MKSTFAVAFFLLLFHDGVTQKTPKLSPSNLRNLAGCWQGTLTYLDYTSGKPFSMPAALKVDTAGIRNITTVHFSYPEEPAANGTDSLIISDNGTRLNGERIMRKNNTASGLQIVTEKNGIDGNDNRAALIRHTYYLSKKTYTVKKEVFFSGEKKWIMRNLYSFTKRVCMP